MDALDHAILDELVRDGRITNVELASRVGLTPGPCLRRVQRLEADGVIRGYRAELDPAAVGRGFEVILHVDLVTQEAAVVAHFEAEAGGFPEVVEMKRLFGSPDYFLRIAAADLARYEEFLTGRIMSIRGVGKVSSHFSMKNIKG
ncbi:Lrp/AsnC family transcriptional regulator [Leucobacter chromiireducens]|uniref:Lrp/AsnC family transcriptional regulator n=1 Tax=Leucobacter chromiireducens subsp. solipictus TaxID=398235 RepID=A0ABS1SCS1_9MICO|nr:Lrp/AsnC family transcriptional regulator [Leucobacter chromiireducens]MBL3678142.1 Lrp/AsnC family transcriptional regulator [Leucobacter chromiireducens subsp. solipictus]